MSRKEKFEIEVTRKLLGDLFTTCMESAYSEWVHDASIAKSEENNVSQATYVASNVAYKVDHDGQGLVWWGHEKVWECPELVIELKYDLEKDPEGSGRGLIHLRVSDLLRGLSARAAKDGAHSLGMILNDDMDGPSADCWLQHVVFGKLVYG
jgi:hypothetical protein